MKRARKIFREIVEEHSLKRKRFRPPKGPHDPPPPPDGFPGKDPRGEKNPWDKKIEKKEPRKERDWGLIVAIVAMVTLVTLVMRNDAGPLK